MISEINILQIKLPIKALDKIPKEISHYERPSKIQEISFLNLQQQELKQIVSKSNLNRTTIHISPNIQRDTIILFSY